MVELAILSAFVSGLAFGLLLGGRLVRKRLMREVKLEQDYCNAKLAEVGSKAHRLVIYQDMTRLTEIEEFLKDCWR